MHTLARPAGQHSEFYPHLGWQAARRSCPRYALCRKPEPSTSWIVATSTLPAFMCCTKPGPSSSRVPSRTSMLIASIRRRRIARPASFATRPSPWTASTPVRITPNFCGAIRFKDPESGKTLVFITSNFSLPAATICALYKSRWQVELFFKWIKQHLRIKQFYGTSENAVKYADRGLNVSVYGPRQPSIKKRLDLDRLALHFVTDPLGDPLRENAHTSSTCGRRKQMQRFANNQPIECYSIFNRTLVTYLNNIHDLKPLKMVLLATRSCLWLTARTGAAGHLDQCFADRIGIEHGFFEFKASKFVAASEVHTFGIAT